MPLSDGDGGDRDAVEHAAEESAAPGKPPLPRAPVTLLRGPPAAPGSLIIFSSAPLGLVFERPVTSQNSCTCLIVHITSIKFL